jgi:outer membrane lipoprotein-sorting protein
MVTRKTVARVGGLVVANVLLSMAATAADAAAEKLLADVEQKVAKIQSYQADMAMSMKVMNQAMSTKGKVIFKKPNRSHMDFETDMGAMKMKQTVVSNGKTTWTYQPLMNMVSTIDMEKLAAAGIPGVGQNQGANDLSKPFQGVNRDTITALGTETIDGVETQAFEATPDLSGAPNMPFKPAKVQMWLGMADGVPRRVVMLDQAGQETMSQTYTNVVLNGEFPDSQFEFTPPANAQVLDMTEGTISMMKQMGGKTQPAAAPAAAPAAPQKQ